MNDQRQYILLCDDDDAITEALSYTLDREGRTVILCSDIDAAEVVLAQFPITHIVTDVQFTGDFGFEGLHFLSRVRTLSPSSRIVLMTGNPTDALQRAAIEQGAVSVLGKPFGTRELENALTDGTRTVATGPYEVIRFPSMDDILRGHGMTTAFQPIVRMDGNSGTTFGYEALTRVSGNWLMGGPVALFEYAQRRGKLIELNITAMECALQHAASLPADTPLFINLDPPAFSSPRLVPSLYAAAARAGVALDRIVLEVTERSGFADNADTHVFAELREAGVRFALDDHGSAYSHLQQISTIRPSFIKVSNTFGTAFELDAAKERIVRHTVALARDFGCETILEGIESGCTARAAVDAGVGLVQGFHFGHARTAAHWAAAKTSSWAA